MSTRTWHGRMRARKLQRDPGSSRCFDTLRSPTAANALASSCPAIPLPTGRSAGLRDGRTSKSFMAKHRTPWKPEKTNSSQTLGHMTHSSSGHTGGLRGRPRRGAASESAAAASRAPGWVSPISSRRSLSTTHPSLERSFYPLHTGVRRVGAPLELRRLTGGLSGGVTCAPLVTS